MRNKCSREIIVHTSFPRPPDFNDDTVRGPKPAARQERAFISHRQSTPSELKRSTLRSGGEGVRHQEGQWREHLFRTYRYSVRRSYFGHKACRALKCDGGDNGHRLTAVYRLPRTDEGKWAPCGKSKVPGRTPTAVLLARMPTAVHRRSYLTLNSSGHDEPMAIKCNNVA